MSFSKLGVQHTVNSTVAGDQAGSAVVQLLNGDIVVAWTDTNGSAVNVRGQILNADGVTKDGVEFMLNTTLTGDQFDVALTALGNGGFAAGWTSSAEWPVGSNPTFELSNSGAQNHVVTQVYNSAGGRIGGEETHFLDDNDYPWGFNGSDTHFQTSATLTANVNGEGDDFDLFAVDELYTYNSTYLPPLEFLNYESGHNNIASFSSGGGADFIVSADKDVTWDWDDSISVLESVHPADFDELDRFHDPKAITLADGTVVTAYWREANASSLGGVHIDIEGRSGTVRLGSSGGASPAVSELENGNLVVVWADDINSTDGLDDIRAQILRPDGTKIGGEFAVTSAANWQWTPVVAGLTDGRFIVVWEDLAGDGDGSAIRAQVFTAGGIKSGEDFIVNTATDDDQTAPTVTALANGDALVTWTDHFGSTDIYSQVLDLQTYVGDSSAETVHGGDDDDHLDGGDGADTLHGGGGDDVFENITQDDLDDGDVFYGEAGIDTLDFDEYLIGAGNSTILIGANGSVSGVEIINLHGSSLQAGLNLVRLAIPLANSSSTGNVTVNGGLMTDFVYGDNIGNSAISLFLNGKEGNDYLYGGAGDDTLSGGEGGDRMVGGAGDDIYLVDSLDDTVTEVGGLQPIFARGDLVIASIDYTLGPNLENLALSGTANLRATGNSIANEIVGNSGENTLFGLGGNDHLYGEDDNDELDGGEGADEMEGGEGDDLYVVDSIGDVVTEFAGEGDADIVFSSIETELGTEVENLWLTGTGNIGGEGNAKDNLIVGNGGDNGLYGNAGADTLYGFAGRDTLDGGGNGDTLYGGADADDLWGRSGADTFRFATLAENGSETLRDTIRDFAAGTDKIDLTDLGFSSLVSGVFTGTAGELRTSTGANTFLFGDADGDRVADFYLILTGVVPLELGDFIL